MRDVSILTDNGVDLNSALELLGDLSFYDETLEAFLAENESRLPNIEKYKKELNMEDYAILVHALKSDSKYLGFKSLADIAYAHELASKANNVDEVNKKYEDLIKELEKVTDLAKKYLG
ncbi:MAG: Hpt domain-containing protein [Firmicutes bacterium]|nr:Hpt domain-containing protein [Bacillota bacterium]